MTEYTFEHNGIKIDLLPSGQFAATVGGKTLTAPSLAAIKKKLNGSKAFQEFPALMVLYGAIREVRAVGITKNKYGTAWKLSNGETRHEVYADTPENRAALRAFLEQAEANNQEAARRNAELRATLAAIPTIRPEGAK
jgi:hypothetical protein